ncbi:hypothetical protein AURDEDRAFT_57222 [Auricularia subglabra TFB-10046 SS5]|nr:hypothetical protein AURDEDRAFT_57222 [Auricularia subglabra TFB-10046 SS5]
MPDPQSPLATILTPQLLHDAFEGRIPWPKERELEFSLLVSSYFLGDFDVETFRDICYPALKQLSAVPLDAIPDLVQYLPPPEDPTYPVQAVGLLLLLDQGPRMLLEGADERWTLGFFDVLALRVARRLFVELPENWRPCGLLRWRAMGYGVGHWLVAILWAIAPLTHSEHLSDHEAQLRILADIRRTVQEQSNTVDPYDEIREQLHASPTALYHAISNGPPAGDDIEMQDFAYWIMAMIYEGHSCVVRTFGRVPFYNGALGRDDTEEEKQFLASVNRMGCVAPETERRIRKDIAAGRWTPLGG